MAWRVPPDSERLARLEGSVSDLKDDIRELSVLLHQWSKETASLAARLAELGSLGSLLETYSSNTAKLASQVQALDSKLAAQIQSLDTRLREVEQGLAGERQKTAWIDRVLSGGISAIVALATVLFSGFISGKGVS